MKVASSAWPSSAIIIFFNIVADFRGIFTNKCMTYIKYCPSCLWLPVFFWWEVGAGVSLRVGWVGGLGREDGSSWGCLLMSLPSWLSGNLGTRRWGRIPSNWCEESIPFGLLSLKFWRSVLQAWQGQGSLHLKLCFKEVLSVWWWFLVALAQFSVV